MSSNDRTTGPVPGAPADSVAPADVGCSTTVASRGAKLTAHLAQKYGVPLDRNHIVGHYQVVVNGTTVCSGANSYSYCVGGRSGRVTAVFNPRGRIALITSTASGNGAGGIGPGDSAGPLCYGRPPWRGHLARWSELPRSCS